MKNTTGICLSRKGVIAGLCLLLVTACASRPFHVADVDDASFIQRALSEEQGPLRVTIAVPDARETKSLTGLDLYSQGIQPVWLQIENNSSERVRFAPWSVDRDYFSAIEVAYMNRKKFSSQGYVDMERWFYTNAMERFIPPGESRSGLVYTHLVPGSKGVNLDIFLNLEAYSFTFFVPMPGFTADYSTVDFASLYTDAEIREFDEGGLSGALEKELPCCTTDAAGEGEGIFLNTVLVGTPLAVRRSLLRGGWLESAVDDSESDWARSQYYRKRTPDTVFHTSRDDGSERLELRLWLSPWRVNSEPVWVGQAIYTHTPGWLESNVDAELLRQFLNESPSADLDSARQYVFQNFWYNQSLLKLGYVGSVKNERELRKVFDGVEYSTDGRRVVLFLSETPVALDDAEIIYPHSLIVTGGDNAN